MAIFLHHLPADSNKLFNSPGVSDLEERESLRTQQIRVSVEEMIRLETSALPSDVLQTANAKIR